jgi:cob(I)alamin adenosyltransferase
MASATLHVCRTVCRRAERKVVALAQDEHVHPSVSIYLNRCVARTKFRSRLLVAHHLFFVLCRFFHRLSDFCFVAARFAAMKAGKPEVIYKKEK